MSKIELNDVSVSYIVGDFSNVGLKDVIIQKIKATNAKSQSKGTHHSMSSCFFSFFSFFSFWKNSIFLSFKSKLNIVLSNPLNPTINFLLSDKAISTLHCKKAADSL